MNTLINLKAKAFIGIFFLYMFFSCNSTVYHDTSKILHLTYKVSKVTILATSDGSIDLSVTGGEKPYQYRWSNGNTSEDLHNLQRGVYTITITDANDNYITRAIEVGKVEPIFCEKGTLLSIKAKPQNKKHISTINLSKYRTAGYNHILSIQEYLPY